MKVVLFNGPRGVGKDTAALALTAPGWFSLSVMRATKAQVLRNHGIDPALLDVFDSIKDTPMPEFGGKSLREAVIDFANAMRALDPMYFARLWRETASRVAGARVIVVPDCRFYEEFYTALDMVGPRNLLVVRVMRPGHDWRGDVGTYIWPDRLLGVRSFSLMNDGGVIDYVQEARVVVGGWAHGA